MFRCYEGHGTWPNEPQVRVVTKVRTVKYTHTIVGDKNKKTFISGIGYEPAEEQVFCLRHVPTTAPTITETVERTQYRNLPYYKEKGEWQQEQ